MAARGSGGRQARRRVRGHDEAGQTAAEYVGVLAVVALVFLGLAATGLGARVSAATSTAVCNLLGSCDGARAVAGAPGAGGAGSGGTGAGGDRVPAAAPVLPADDGYDVEWPPPGGAGPEPRGAGTTFFDGLIKGNYDDRDPASGGEAWSRAGGQLVSSVLVYGDVRDGSAAVGDLWGSGGRDGWGDLFWSGVGLVPVGGDIVKGLRAGDDAIDATRAANRAIEAGRAATAVRSADDIAEAGARLSQQRLEHIVARHWPTSGAANAGKFAEGTTLRRLTELLDDAVRSGTHRPNTRNRPGTIFEHDFGSAIGVDIAGVPTSRLRVVVDPGGNVVTAFPY